MRRIAFLVSSVLLLVSETGCTDPTWSLEKSEKEIDGIKGRAALVKGISRERRHQVVFACTEAGEVLKGRYHIRGEFSSNDINPKTKRPSFIERMPYPNQGIEILLSGKGDLLLGGGSAVFSADNFSSLWSEAVEYCGYNTKEDKRKFAREEAERKKKDEERKSKWQSEAIKDFDAVKSEYQLQKGSGDWYFAKKVEGENRKAKPKDLVLFSWKNMTLTKEKLKKSVWHTKASGKDVIAIGESANPKNLVAMTRSRLVVNNIKEAIETMDVGAEYIVAWANTSEEKEIGVTAWQTEPYLLVKVKIEEIIEDDPAILEKVTKEIQIKSIQRSSKECKLEFDSTKLADELRTAYYASREEDDCSKNNYAWGCKKSPKNEWIDNYVGYRVEREFTRLDKSGRQIADCDSISKSLQLILSNEV